MFVCELFVNWSQKCLLTSNGLNIFPVICRVNTTTKKQEIIKSREDGMKTNKQNKKQEKISYGDGNGNGNCSGPLLANKIKKNNQHCRFNKHIYLGELILWQGTSRLCPNNSWFRSTIPHGAIPILTTRPVRCCPSNKSASPTCFVTPEIEFLQK